MTSDPSAGDEYPPIPGKRYFTIGEVSDLCGVKPHVLRYWEKEFPQLNPEKRRGNRRYYQRRDVLIIRQIRELLYDQGFTIGAARARLIGESGPLDLESSAYSSNRDSDSARNAYLFTWNPNEYPFPDFDKHVENLISDDVTQFRWSTGTNPRVEIGDRTFLMRQGQDSPGIVGVGVVSSEIESDDHWERDKAAKGVKQNFVRVGWTALSRNPLLPRKELDKVTGEKNIWRSQSGGRLIPPDIVKKLDEALLGGTNVQEAHIDARQWIANFNADKGGDDDSLDIDRYVNAFGRVIASKTLQPPLSIGLFGDWGSGKTFFMTRLSRKVYALQTEEADSDNPPYVENICQINFNAWHYAETDLWASLVSNIFQGLRRQLDSNKEDPDAFNKILQKLEIAGELRKDAEDRLEAAETAFAKAREELEISKKALKESPPPTNPTGQELRTILAESFQEIAPNDIEKVARLLDDVKTLTGRDEFGKSAQAIRNGKARVDEVRSLVNDIRPLYSKSSFWWNILHKADVHKSLKFWLVIGVLIAIPVLAYFASQKTDALQIWFVMAEVGTIVGAAVAWLRKQLDRSSSVIDRLDSAQAAIQRRIDEREDILRIENESEFHAREFEHIEAQQVVTKATEALTEATIEEEDAKLAVKESSSEARLGRFIRDRASSADYEKHLGLIALIHRDFERLSDLIRGDSEYHDAELPTIDRIVLYIDDLDRCHPPKKVVQVLEAVHLLLFFPLFVVVVGVDSRWVSRALYNHYEGMLGDESRNAGNGPASTDERAPADSQDFLEKIFQVPFWLRRMEEKGVKRLSAT